FGVRSSGKKRSGPGHGGSGAAVLAGCHTGRVADYSLPGVFRKTKRAPSRLVMYIRTPLVRSSLDRTVVASWAELTGCLPILVMTSPARRPALKAAERGLTAVTSAPVLASVTPYFSASSSLRS